MTDKKFNLTEKRKKLLNDFEWIRHRYDKLDLVRKIFALVEKQDAEFIRRERELLFLYKTGVISWEEMIKRRDNLSGTAFSNQLNLEGK